MATLEGIHITIEDNSPEVLAALQNAIKRGLTACGLTAEKYAREKCPRSEDNNADHLIDHITSTVEDNTMIVGVSHMSPTPYGIYVEFGTGIYAEEGGRPTPWVYRDKNGNWHKTRGMRPQPFIRPSITDHMDEYKKIMKESLENA